MEFCREKLDHGDTQRHLRYPDATRTHLSIYYALFHSDTTKHLVELFRCLKKKKKTIVVRRDLERREECGNENRYFCAVWAVIKQRKVVNEVRVRNKTLFRRWAGREIRFRHRFTHARIA